MIESMEGTQADRGAPPSLSLSLSLSRYTNESLVAIVRMEFRTVIKPIGVTSVSIGGLLHLFLFFFFSWCVSPFYLLTRHP
jgi:hypothetical protein